LQGISTDDDHLAFEAIREAGPGGNYLVSKHTFDHLRSEYFQGNGVSDKGNREQWIKNGELSARDRAVGIVRDILSRPAESKIAPDIEEDIRRDFDVYMK
jgi:trimethylamine--corrinoid protein Co-methyltransferase